MRWVLDASVAVAWCIDDETPRSLIELYRNLPVSPPIVPQLWSLEVANVLTLAVRKGRITAAKRSEFIATLNAAEIEFDLLTHTLAFSSILTLAEAHRLTVYDAAYLELALRFGLPLATLDKALAAAAQAAGVTLL